MPTSNNKTAILFFSRSAQVDAKNKLLLRGKSQIQNTQLVKALTNRSLEKVKESDLQVFHLDEKSQIGNSFGEKISNAFEYVFCKGYQSVICVGNDVSDLGHIQWNTLASELQEGKSILGPDKRNGAYLIGLNKEIFSKDAFQNLGWQTKSLYQDLQKYTSDYKELETKSDLNSWTDIQLVIKQSGLLKRLIQVITNLSYVSTESKLLVSIATYSHFGLRAPPLSH